MAETVAPAEVPPEPPVLPWPNKKEDYELLDVIGQCTSS